MEASWLPASGDQRGAGWKPGLWSEAALLCDNELTGVRVLKPCPPQINISLPITRWQAALKKKTKQKTPVLLRKRKKHTHTFLEISSLELITQLCLTLCDPKVCSPSGSSVHGTLQARILEWVAMPSSRGSESSKRVQFSV